MKITRPSLLTLFCAALLGPVAFAQDASSPTIKPKPKTKAEIKEEQAKAEAAAKKAREPFLQRLNEAFFEQLSTPAYVPSPPDAPTTRRIPPAPFDSPPYPNGDWQIGGSPIIGDPGELPPWPLMQALYEGPGGEA